MRPFTEPTRDRALAAAVWYSMVLTNKKARKNCHKKLGAVLRTLRAKPPVLASGDGREVRSAEYASEAADWLVSLCAQCGQCDKGVGRFMQPAPDRTREARAESPSPAPVRWRAPGTDTDRRA